MSLELYKTTSVKLSKIFTHSYSTSFSWGIRAFAPEYRAPIYSIYGFVRIADEIVDTFHDHDKVALMEKLRTDTKEAIDLKISTNPILNAFAEVVNKYNIEWELIDAFLNSMEMDLTESSYDRLGYDEYVYGSAEVVGLMCLKVFVDGDQKKYDELAYSARMLGAAFQKVNFLRDIKSDLDERGRIYLPNVHHGFLINEKNKKALENEISKEFNVALDGIKKLPIHVKLGVYSAYLYFFFLFRKIQKVDVDTLLSRRVRISNFKKLALLLKSILEVKVFKVT